MEGWVKMGDPDCPRNLYSKKKLEVAMFFFSAPKFVVFIIRFVDVAKDIAERNYYLFAHKLLNFRKVRWLFTCVLRTI